MSRTGDGDFPRRSKGPPLHKPSEEGEHGELDSLDSSQEDASENTSILSSSSEIDVLGSPQKTRRRSPRIQANQNAVFSASDPQRGTKLKVKRENAQRSKTQELARPPLRGPKDKSSTKDKKTESTDSDSSFITYIIVFGVLLGCFGVYVSIQERGSDSIPEVSTVSDKFTKEYQDFMSKFPSQTERFFKVLKAASRQIIEKDNPSQPAVFIIVFSKTSIRTRSCLIKQFLKTIRYFLSPHLTKPYESLVIPEVSVSSLGDLSDAKAVKIALDNEMFTALTDHNVVAVHDIHQLPGQAALMFHGYCDNDNAPFKKAAIVLTLEMPQESLQERMDEMVEKHLADIWGNQLETDQLTAVLSRVANNIAVITPEKDKTVAKGCDL